MTTHTHLLTLGTGPDREEIRLREVVESDGPGMRWLEDEHGYPAADWDDTAEDWTLNHEYCAPITWTLEAV